MSINKLKYMPHAQAFVEVDDQNNITLVSYTTPVATISDGELWIAGLYSMTTRRHLKAFVKEYISPDMEFSEIKYLAENPVKLDLWTGEVVNI